MRRLFGSKPSTDVGVSNWHSSLRKSDMLTQVDTGWHGSHGLHGFTRVYTGYTGLHGFTRVTRVTRVTQVTRITQVTHCRTCECDTHPSAKLVFETSGMLPLKKQGLLLISGVFNYDPKADRVRLLSIF